MRVILYMAMTVNGMIAKENDETPWSEAAWESYAKIVKSVGNIVIGQRTYEIIKQADELVRIGRPYTVVVTEDVPESNHDQIIFAPSPRAALENLKKQGFAKVLVGGGATLNASFMELGLVDEIILDVEPLLFGKGIPLFRPTDFQATLELIEAKQIAERLVQFRYKVMKQL